MNNISLMMVTYNRLELTKQTVENIYQTTDLDFNFIIVDNGSTDGTTEYLKKLENNKNNVYLEFNKENEGIARGRNKGLKLADDLNTNWFVTIDNDVLVTQNAIKNCIDIIKINPNYSIGINFENVNYPLVTLNGYEFQNKQQGNLGTAFMTFSLSLHKMIGFFTTNYNLYSHEDANWGFRARIAGFKMGYLKENGIHIGSGENDIGEYREFKNTQSKQNLQTFYNDCKLYLNKIKPIYIPYKP